jgi:2-oxoglutarate ferredoxin oxidoreductase subunit alpha
MPSKVEQADLLQALHGRNGECPLIVLALATPADGYAITLEAIRLAVRAMSPVIVLADAYLTLAEEPWRVPALSELPTIEVHHPSATGTGFLPYQRDENLSRPWATPGTPGLEHRIGGLEKEDRTGNVSYDPIDHEKMVQLRAEKIARVAHAIPPLEVEGPPQGELLVLGWGSTYGAIRTAAERCRRAGVAVANAHLRYLNPLPANIASVLGSYRRILVPELNAGQLAQVLRAMFAVDIVGLNKLQGRPFFVSEIEIKIRELVN